MDDPIDPTNSTHLARIEQLDIGAAGSDKHRLLMQTLSEAQVDFLMQRTPKKEIKRVVEWAKANRRFLRQEWERLNERDD